MLLIVSLSLGVNRFLTTICQLSPNLKVNQPSFRLYLVYKAVPVVDQILLNVPKPKEIISEKYLYMF